MTILAASANPGAVLTYGVTEEEIAQIFERPKELR